MYCVCVLESCMSVRVRALLKLLCIIAPVGLSILGNETPQHCYQCGTSCACNAIREGQSNGAQDSFAHCDFSSLSGSWAKNSWIPAPGTCAVLGVTPENAASCFGGRSFFFMGNSVTRHYAMALQGMFDGIQDKPIDHKTEKNMCQGILGVSSCAAGPNISFFWKNTISVRRAYDDPGRDVCGTSPGDGSIEPCLKALFKQAGPRDVLVMGSLVFDSLQFHQQGYTTMESLDRMLVGAAASARNITHNVVVVDMLLRVFPGLIIWHSYPFLHAAKNDVKLAWDINACSRAVSKQALCAASSARDYRSRIEFVDLSGIQSTRLDLYKDLIHHPGILSEQILKVLLSMLRPNRGCPAS